MITIDAKEAIAGRIATYAAKKSLLGEEIAIVNAEQAVITGTKVRILADYKQKLARGTPTKGPLYSRIPERLLRRVVRGMLPHKQPRGAAAFKRIMCYKGIPDKFKNEKLVTVPGSHVSKTKSLKYMTLADLARLL